ncbi:MAG: ABC transporter permease [Flavobacteriaceae bacterium]|nr:ABC transporter permease [Flavobacteriaceae bacterium]
MHKLWQSTYKEFLLLKRDIGGLVILFVMPLILVITVTLIQENTSQHIFNSKINILLIDNDVDALSKTIISNLANSNSFEVVTEIDGKHITEEQVNDLVLSSKYKFAIIIPKDLTKNLSAKVSQNVSKILEEFEISENEIIENKVIEPQQIKLYFDPTIQLSFRNGIKNAIDNMISKIETQSIYKAFKDELEIDKDVFKNEKFITFLEINPQKNNKEIKPNSVQHNVPAWALFAIFFIIVPLSINIVNEKNQGTFVRLKTNPISYATILGGKVIIYLIVCLIQFTLMLLVGLYLFPNLGLPNFDVNGSYFLLFLVAIFSGLAAIGIGILIGTIASTHEQSAPFGATLVVILAAIGGVWIPVFAMPNVMQLIAKISPMNWGLNCFYDVIIRDNSFIEILPKILLMGIFFIVITAIAINYDKAKNTM